LLSAIWTDCVNQLRSELPEQQFNTWIRPLRAESGEGGEKLTLVAPNRFILDWVNDKFLGRIEALASQMGSQSLSVELAGAISSIATNR